MPNYRALGDAAVAARWRATSTKVFAGPRDDPFYADLGAIFDLGGLRPLNSAHLIPSADIRLAVTTLAGFNVHSIVLQVPSSRIVPMVILSSACGRRRRVASPARVVPLTPGSRWLVSASRSSTRSSFRSGAKDLFNSSSPDKDLQFAKGVLEPELGKLIPVPLPRREGADGSERWSWPRWT